VAISTAEGGSSSVNANINVTPMIDVMLVLLIIFMIVTPVIAAGFTATMPVAADPTMQAEGDDEITLGIDNSGNFFVNGVARSAADAEAELRSLFATRELDKLLYFKADANLPYSTIQQGVEMGRRAGAAVLVAITDRKGGLEGDEEGN
jgi:biopolymer transport protein ExbD